MIPRLARETETAPPPPGDLVDGWLSVFVGLLRVPEKQAANIGEEIESHLRDRVRDLMLSGISESEASRKAISELGEAADVAARYRALRGEPTRRFIMHASLFTAAGAALALSIAAMTGGRSQSAQQQADAALRAQQAQDAAVVARERELLARLDDERAKSAEAQRLLASTLARPDSTKQQEANIVDLLDQAAAKASELPASDREMVLATLLKARAAAAKNEGAAEYIAADQPELDVARFDVEFTDTAAADVFKALGELIGMPVTVQWQQVEASGLGRDQSLSLRARQVTAPVAIRIISESQNLTGAKSIECRMTNGVLEIAPREFFDRRERTLVTYDLSGIISARHETYGEDREVVVPEIRSLICNFVSAEDWRDNGGELAQMSVVGDRLFVEAPARIHPQVKWILDQLPSDKKHTDSGARVPYLSDLPVIGYLYRGAPAQRGADQIRVYPIKFISAEDALKSLMKLQSIKKIDFTPFACDPRTNSILGKASEDELKMVEEALKRIDRPAEKQGESAPVAPDVAAAK